MSGDICIDNRFELIGKYQKILIDRTNITDDPDEMKVLYRILYRCWQMGWLDRLDTIADMLDENAKLRKLVSRLICHIENPPCESCMSEMSCAGGEGLTNCDEYQFMVCDARKLGVEVD